MQTCTNCNALSPDAATQCEQCGVDLGEYSSTAVALKSFQANPRVRYVRIVVAQDSCPACQEKAGAYEKDQAPRLPTEACSHPGGCRCFYLPFLEEIYP